MTLAERMSPTIRTLDASCTLKEAAQIMKTSNVGLLPIVGAEGRPLGVVTDRDIVIRAVAEGISPNASIERVMTREVVSMRLDRSIDEALDLMRQKNIGRILVGDARGRVVGVFSLGDAAASMPQSSILDAVSRHSHAPLTRPLVPMR